jgi:hypothetical protein
MDRKDETTSLQQPLGLRAFHIDRKKNVPSNGLRYWQVGGRGLCLGAEKLEARKMLENGDESHLSSARFVGRRLTKSPMLNLEPFCIFWNI